MAVRATAAAHSVMVRPVLIVEDDGDIRESLVDLLTSIGFEVRGARNGLEALRLLERMETPCLILLDLSMPVMSGEEFRERQLADPALARVPVILITADTAGRETAKRLRIEAVLQKPFDPGLLMAAIGRYWDLNLGRAADGQGEISRR